MKKLPDITHADCPYIVHSENGKTECKILDTLLCRRKECGFYPPIAEARKAKIRADRAELLEK